MKAIMYISQATTKGSAPWMPYDYAALTKACRESNRLNEITGILSYQDGYFLQYIEGPSKQIDRLIVKISSDKRHENIQLLMNSDIAQRNFSTWSMPMGGKLRKDEDFAKFANRYRAIFFDLTDSTRECLNKFYPFDTERQNASVLRLLSQTEKPLSAHIAN